MTQTAGNNETTPPGRLRSWAARQRRQVRLPRPVVDWSAWRRLEWQTWVFLAIVVVALGTRLWDLGGRTLHYDEILHAHYSWRFAEGLGYSHNPLTHGPLLFHIAAGSFWLFGSNDVTARLVPALFGTALVGLPWLLRKQLGIYGVLATASLLALSPSILYFGRFIRNDIYMAVWLLLLVAIVCRHLERPRTRLLVAWVVVWALAYSTKESAFLLAGIFGLFLFIVSAPALWNWVRGRARLSDVPPAGQLLILLGTLSLPLWAPFVSLIQEPLGIVLVNPDALSHRVESGEIVRAAVETGAPAGSSLYIAAYIVGVFAVLSVLIGLLWDRRRWPLLAAVFGGIWLLLFTSVFTNWQGFFTGLWGSAGYWIAQQDVTRADQPWYYYIVGLSTYEFLVILPGVIGGVYLLAKGAAFDRLIVAWAVLTFVMFSYAAERMPWLLVGVTVPFAVVAGRAVGMLIESALRTRLSLVTLLGGLGAAFFAPVLLLRIIRSDSPLTDIWLWLAVVGLLATAGAVVWTADRLRTRGLPERPPFVWREVCRKLFARRGPLFSGAALGVLTILVVFTAFVAGRAAYFYSGFERPTELLVYSQSGQETSYAAECIERVARDSGIGRENLRLLTGESDNFAWQWRWYLRDYPNLDYRYLNDSPLDAPPDVDVVLMSRSVEDANSRHLSEFTRMGEIRHLWWFPNYAYKGITPLSVLSDATDRELVRQGADYFIERKYPGTMYSSTGVIYIANRLAPLAEGCTDLRATDERDGRVYSDELLPVRMEGPLLTSRRLWLGFAVTGAFLAVLFLKIDLDGMRSALAEANYVYLLPAVLVYFASFYARAVRWRYVLGPFARVRANRLYPVIMVGYMANNVLPMRLGEVARSYYLSTREPVRASTALATVVIERVFDGLTLLFFLAAAALFLPVPGLADRMADSVSVPVWLLAIAVIAPFVGVLFLMVTAAVYPDVFLRVARWITGKLPERFGQRAYGLTQRFIDGFEGLHRPSKLAAVFGLSLPVWVLEGASYYIVALGFDLQADFNSLGLMIAAMLVLTSAANLATSIPSSQGSVGPFEFFAVLSLEFLGLPPALLRPMPSCSTSRCCCRPSSPACSTSPRAA